MADEKRQLVLDILANAKTKAGTDKAARDLDDVADAADKVSDSNEKLGKSQVPVIDGQKKLSAGAQEFKGRIEGLNREIGLSQHELEGLHKSYADTADATERKDLGKGIRKLEGDLKKLQKTKTSLLSSKEGKGFLDDLFPDAGKQGGKQAAGLGELASSLSKALGPVAVGAAVGVAPLVGGIISAAVVGTAGGLGIVGGAILAARDPRIKTAGSELGKHLLGDLTNDAKVFVAPILSELNKTGQYFETTLSPDVAKLFSSSAKLIAPLASGLRSLSGSVLGGLASAASKAGPVFTVLATRVAGIGDAIGDAFRTLGNDGPAAAAALDQGLRIVEGTIRVVVGGVDLLTKAYGFLAKVGAFGKDTQIAYLSALAEAGKDATGSSDDLSGAFGRLVSGSTKAATAIGAQRQALVDLATEEKAQSDPVYALIDAQGRLATAQSDTNKAIKKYGEDSPQARAATADLVKAVLDLQTASGQLGGALAGEVSPQLLAALQAANLTKPEIDAVAGAFRNAKKAGDNFSGTYRAKIVTDYINNIYQNSFLTGVNAGYNQTKKSLAHRASGGSTVRGEAYVVGENGPEVWTSDASGRILSAAGSRGLAVQAAKAGTPVGSGQPGKVQVEVVGSDQRLVSLLKYLIRTANVIETA